MFFTGIILSPIDTNAIIRSILIFEPKVKAKKPTAHMIKCNIAMR